MSPVSASNGGNSRCMTRCREPVVDRGADLAALDRRLSRAMMTGDQQHDALAAGDGVAKPAVDRPPRAVEGHAVEVEDSVGLDNAVTQPPVPAAVERVARNRPRRGRG
jgi:hypothetical protein